MTATSETAGTNFLPSWWFLAVCPEGSLDGDNRFDSGTEGNEPAQPVKNSTQTDAKTRRQQRNARYYRKHQDRLRLRRKLWYYKKKELEQEKERSGRD